MSETPSKHATDNPSASSPERQNDPVQEGNEERSQGPQTETQTEIPDSMKESTREGEQKKGKEPEEHKENTEREEEQEEEGEASAPPLPDEILPPLPNEAPPSEDDGWEPVWDANVGAFYFYNRFTGMSQWDNPRVPEVAAEGPPGVEASASSSEKQAPPALGGYNPVIHGDYDPTAPYAQQYERPPNEEASAGLPVTDQYAALGQFNRFTGRWQAASQNPEQHNDQNKSYRQMNAFFDVDAAANSHDGRSLRAERSAKKLTKKELKMFKEKRREKKEEKRRAWLRD